MFTSVHIISYTKSFCKQRHPATWIGFDALSAAAGLAQAGFEAGVFLSPPQASRGSRQEMKRIAIAMLVASMGSTWAQADDAVQCAARPDLAAPCYQVHGRLNAWNGGPATEKIWVIGTKRILAVYDRTTLKMTMPKAIDDQLDDFYTQIIADYQVCPLEKEIPDHESYVCIESAKSIRIEHHEAVDGKDRLKDVKHIPDTAPGTLIEL